MSDEEEENGARTTDECEGVGDWLPPPPPLAAAVDGDGDGDG